MLGSNNLNSIIDDLSAFSSPAKVEALRPSTLQLEKTTDDFTAPLTNLPETFVSNNSQFHIKTNAPANAGPTEKSSPEPVTESTSLAALQLTAGVLQTFAPPIAKAKGQLKELIQKQNKIYIDLSAEKFKLDNAEVAKLHEMMNNVKVCREKLLKIKKNMQNIYQRTKVLKKRAINIQTCKEKELQRKIQKQQQEESLIGKQPQ